MRDSMCGVPMWAGFEEGHRGVCPLVAAAGIDLNSL